MAGILGNSMKKLLCICAAALALAGCGKKEEETGLVITSAVEPVSEPADMRDYQWLNDEGLVENEIDVNAGYTLEYLA